MKILLVLIFGFFAMPQNYEQDSNTTTAITALHIDNVKNNIYRFMDIQDSYNFRATTKLLTVEAKQLAEQFTKQQEQIAEQSIPTHNTYYSLHNLLQRYILKYNPKELRHPCTNQVEALMIKSCFMDSPIIIKHNSYIELLCEFEKYKEYCAQLTDQSEPFFIKICPIKVDRIAPMHELKGNKEINTVYAYDIRFAYNRVYPEPVHSYHGNYKSKENKYINELYAELDKYGQYFSFLMYQNLTDLPNTELEDHKPYYFDQNSFNKAFNKMHEHIDFNPYIVALLPIYSEGKIIKYAFLRTTKNITEIKTLSSAEIDARPAA